MDTDKSNPSENGNDVTISLVVLLDVAKHWGHASVTMKEVRVLFKKKVQY